MLAAQLLASHNAAMECYRRAMISEQTFEGRKENLNQANKLFPDTRRIAGSIEPPPRQRTAESHRRTCSRPRRRTSHCWQRGGGWDANENGESTPCNYTCTGPNVAERERGAGSRAGSQRWRTVGAACMGDLRQEHRRAIGMHSSTVAIRQTQLRDVVRFRP